MTKTHGIEGAAGIQAVQTVLNSKKRNTNNSVAGIIAFSFFVLIGGYTTLQTDTAGYLMAEYTTGIGENRTIELDDHSRIIMNTYSAVDIAYDDNRRLIQLRKGEILLEVAKDKAKPFIVQTKDGTARALGTKFVVKRDNNSTLVTVIESIVETCNSHSIFNKKQVECIQLHPNQAALIESNQAPIISDVDAQALSSWTTGYLSVDNVPLNEVLAEIERYRSGKIILKSSELGNLRVSGVFPIKDTDWTLEVLTGLLPIQYKTYSSYLTVIEPKPD